MDKIKIKNALIAVSEKSSIDRLLPVLKDLKVKIWATEGTAKYIKSKGFDAQSIVSGFDFDGRVKSLDRQILAQVLTDQTKKSHLDELKKWNVEPFDAVIVELYKLDQTNFPESMDIGGVTLIRATIKNFENVAVAFDEESIAKLVGEISERGEISSEFRKQQAKKASHFIAQRCKLEADLL